MQGARILIIDDEKDFCKLVKASLEQAVDVTVEIATDVKKGMNIAAKLKPDLIFLDILIPGIDGFRVMKELKHNPRTISIPIIIFTSMDDDASKTKAASLYAESYISKAVDVRSLAGEVQRVLERRGIQLRDKEAASGPDMRQVT